MGNSTITFKFLACVITISFLTKCNSKTKNINPTIFINIEKGLQEVHQDQIPLLETEFYRDNEAESVNTQRLYNDGTLYILTNFEGANQWVYFSSVKEEGLNKIQNMAKNLLNDLRAEPKSAVGKHSSVYRLSYNNKIRVFIILGANYGVHHQLSKITNIINSNLKA